MWRVNSHFPPKTAKTFRRFSIGVNLDDGVRFHGGVYLFAASFLKDIFCCSTAALFRLLLCYFYFYCRRWLNLCSCVQSIATGKGIRPKSGQSIIKAEWLASKSDLEQEKARLIPSPEKPMVRAPRAPVVQGNVARTEARDWDIVTPPGSPMHFEEFCSIAGIQLREDIEKLPLLPPAAPGAQVVPFRSLGEQSCTVRLKQFEEMEHQRLGVPLPDYDYLTELQDGHDWNVMERIVWDQKRWEREESKRKTALKAVQFQRDLLPENAESVKTSSELILLEMVEDFDMDVAANGEITSCELECHITAETHLTKQRQLSMWLEKLYLLEECKLHPRVEQQPFRTDQVIKFMPDTEHVIEICNFKVLRSVLASVAPPLRVRPHFMFEDGVCKFHITMSVDDEKVHAQGIDITFPMPDSIIAAPRLQCSGDSSTAVFGNTTKLVRWQCARLEGSATLTGMVAMHPTAPLPTAGPIVKFRFEVVGLNLCGVTVSFISHSHNLLTRCAQTAPSKQRKTRRKKHGATKTRVSLSAGRCTNIAAEAITDCLRASVWMLLHAAQRAGQ